MKKYGILLVKSLVGCVFLAFTLFPIVLLISSSLKIDTEVFDYRIIPKHITLDAYKQVFRILDIFTGIRNSLFVATMVTVLALIVHSMAAFAFARLEFPEGSIHVGSEYHDDSFSGNHNSFVFYNQKSWTGEFALGHDTSYGSACIWRIPF